MTLKELQEMIEKVGKTLDPEDDWMPVLFLDKDNQLAMLGIPFMENESQKDMCAFALYAAIKRTNPDRAFFVTTAWASSPIGNRFMSNEDFMEAIRQGWIPQPSQDPDRKEIVNVVMLNKDGKSEMMTGFIKRSKTKPPKIVRWKMHDQPETDVKGRFGDAMRKGFAEADKKGNLDALKELQQGKN